MLKLKVGDANDIHLDVARVVAVREAVGPAIEIKIDVNEGWGVAATATRALSKMEHLDLVCVEQPVGRYEFQAMADVRRKTTIPVMADESVHSARDALSLIRLGACDLMNIKLMKSGGLRRGMDINVIASTVAIPCQIGSMVESAIATAAGLHLAASCDRLDMVELSGPLMLADDVSDIRALYHGDRVSVPIGAGLGIDVDENSIPPLAQSRQWVRN